MGPDSADEKTAIAQAVLSQLGSQVDLATTLATAIAGGLVALIFQVAIHNHSKDAKPIRLRCTGSLTAALIFEGISLVFAYLARGTLTAITPVLLNLPPDAWTMVGTDGRPATREFTYVSFAGSDILAGIMLAQIASLLVGFGCIFIFAICTVRIFLKGATAP